MICWGRFSSFPALRRRRRCIVLALGLVCFTLLGNGLHALLVSAALGLGHCLGVLLHQV